MVAFEPSGTKESSKEEGEMGAYVVFGHELYTVVAMLHGDCSWVLKDQPGHDADILARFAVSEVERI